MPPGRTKEQWPNLKEFLAFHHTKQPRLSIIRVGTFSELGILGPPKCRIAAGNSFNKQKKEMKVRSRLTSIKALWQLSVITFQSASQPKGVVRLCDMQAAPLSRDIAEKIDHTEFDRFTTRVG